MASEVRFSKIRTMLEDAGYELDRISGSHHIFTKPKTEPISVPVHKGKVKPYYVKDIQKRIKKA